MARHSGKRSRRRRRSGGGVISRQLCPTIDPEYTRRVLSSAEESRNTRERYRQAKAEGNPGQRLVDKVQKEAVEIYVGNVPVRTLGRQLGLYVEGFLKRRGFKEDDTGSPVLKCAVHTRRRSSVTYAFVVVRSKEMADAIFSVEHSLGGRDLRTGPSKSARVKRLGTSPGFECLAFQLCAEWPSNELTCLWEVDSGVSFQITGPTSLACLMFKDRRGNKCQADFKRRHVDGEMKMEKDNSGKTWLVFRLLRPPFLQGEPAVSDKDIFGKMPGSGEVPLLPAAFMDLFHVLDGTRSVWQLGGAENGADAKLERIVDVSPNHAFGRCLVYRINVSGLSPKEMSRLCKELHAFRLCRYESEARLLCRPVPVHKITSHTPLDGWESTDRARSLYRDLPYGVKFLIECLVSNLKVEALGMSEEAMALLAQAREKRACLVLRAMFYSDPRHRLERAPAYEIGWWCNFFGPRTGVAQVVGRGNVMIARASVTPLRVVCQPPEEEMSNGVTRLFRHCCDRFLRVSFVDENLGRIQTPLSKAITGRVRDFFNQGLVVSGRRYRFLAYSGSQLRSHSCFFYACPSDEGNSSHGDGGSPTAAVIIESLGDLSDIKVVGKHAARRGQNLSSSRPTVVVKPYMRKLVSDKKSGPYEFTDGVGIISVELARRVCISLGLPLDDMPSAFQIRMGGCKGMLAVWPDSVMEKVAGRSGYSMIVRPSMQKFPSDLDNLAVIQIARALPCYLNRQFVTLLTTLGVPDEPIEELYTTMATALDEMMRSPMAAEVALVRYYNGASAQKTGRKKFGPLWEALSMAKAGFDVQTTPFLQGVLRATRDKAMVELRNRTRIYVPDGVCLIGVVDETGLLKPGEVFFSLKRNPGELPTKNFSVLPPGTPVLVCRNPSLHPGDLRVLRTADIPQLRHLRNVVVFPCVGDRPEPSKMSGGDLDGDIYAVVWDERLLPPPQKRNCEPMGYEPPAKPEREETGRVGNEEITEFFLKYMGSDNLGVIANAHLVSADKSPDGAKCQECLQLAALHSIAVDFAKSGVPAEIPEDLRARKYPDFMRKGPAVSYRSDKLIGRLFRMTPEARDLQEDGCEGEHPPKAFLGGFELDETLLVDGWQDYGPEAEAIFGHYCQYVWSLANKYGVYDEGQLLSGQVERFRAQGLKKVKQEDAQGRLNLEMANVKAYFRMLFQVNSPSEEEATSGAEEEREDEEEEKEEEGEEEEGEEEDEDGSEEDELEDEEGARGSQDKDHRGGSIPAGMELFKKASAWYYVSHSDETNPYMNDARKNWRADAGHNGSARQPELMYLSFPWVCAYQQLCQIKRMKTAAPTSA